MSNDPDLIDVWEECDRCHGEGVVRSLSTGLDVDCHVCNGDGGWES